MIDLLNNLIRQVLIEQIAEFTDEAQIRFQPPDADWRTYVSNLTVGGNPANALNIYLVDLRENRRLRSNERTRSVENGVVSEEPAPARLDCHYLISAWSPATVSPLIEPTLDEHALLYQASAVLFQQAPFNPSRVYPAGSAALNAWPARFRNHDLPATVLPVEGFNKLAEFWSGMGQGAVWKPAIYLVVTLPVALFVEIAGPMVTTRITEYRISGQPGTAEIWIQIGGQVLSPARVVAVGNSAVTGIGAAGLVVTVNNAAPFRVGDIVTANNVARATITQIAGANLTLSNALPGLIVGNNLLIANILPSQVRFRLTDAAGLVPGGTAVIRGDDALNPGTVITDRVVIESVAADGFVTLRGDTARAGTFNLNVAPANAPTIQEALAGVWVELQNPAGARLQITQTNEVGRFTFADLHAGSYRLRAQALGLAPITRVVDVPSPSGEYDLQFV
jgi:uncharacterized protein DUF4255/carboxypeptidase family protein